MTVIQNERVALLKHALSQRIFVIDVKSNGEGRDISFYAFEPKLTLDKKEETLLIEVGAVKMYVDIEELKIVRFKSGPVLCELKLVLYPSNKDKEEKEV
jgi:hypothetical protein